MSKALYFQNVQFSRVMNSKYKSKYKKIKRILKDYVNENAALCDEVSKVQEDLAVAKEERKFLLHRLVQHENDVEPQVITPTDGSEAIATPTQLPVRPHIPGKRGPKKRIHTDAPKKEPKSAKSLQTPPTSAVQKKQLIQPLSLDAHGKPVLPINFGSFILISLGEIMPDNPNFHSDNWIYPVGYVATRVYSHPKEPERKCVFTCKILNNSGVPQFQIIPDAEFHHVFFGESANICHLGLLETITVHCTGVANLPLREQGERFFGLGNPTVMSMIQSHQHFSKCQNFKGFLVDNSSTWNEDKDPTLNFDALQRLITMSAYHTVPEIKEEPPDELLE